MSSCFCAISAGRSTRPAVVEIIGKLRSASALVTVTSRREQVLARHAPDVQTGPAQRAVLDEQHLAAAGPGFDARGHGRAARADDDQVPLLIAHARTLDLPPRGKVKS